MNTEKFVIENAREFNKTALILDDTNDLLDIETVIENGGTLEQVAEMLADFIARRGFDETALEAVN